MARLQLRCTGCRLHFLPMHKSEFGRYRLQVGCCPIRSLTLLREQADIARKLGIEIPAYTIPFSPRQAQNHEVPALGLDTFESYYFMQGYSAIEKQIDNIEQRDEDQNSAFVADIDQLVLDRIIAEKKQATTPQYNQKLVPSLRGSFPRPP